MSPSIVINETSPKKLHGLVTSGEDVGVGVGVGVGDAETGITLASIPIIEQKLVEVGVTVTVGVIVGVGVGDGVGTTSQSKRASKSNTLHGEVVVVVVEQTPELKKSSHKSGQGLVHGDFPDSKQVPPKIVDKHQ